MNRRKDFSRLGLGLIVLSLAVVVGGVPAYGQGLITDRPDFTESGVVVPLGSVQIEAGATVETESSDGSPDVTSLTLGEALIRWGFAPRFEARVELPDHNRISFEDDGSGASPITGTDDLGVGFKYQFGPLGDAGDIDLGFIGKVSIPTGSEEFKSDEVEPEVILAASKDLGDGVGIASQLSAGLPSSDGGRSFEWGATIVSSASFGPVGVFAEFRIDIPEEGTAPTMMHAGLLYPVSDKLQFDVHGGFGLSSTAPDTFFGAGFSVGV